MSLPPLVDLGPAPLAVDVYPGRAASLTIEDWPEDISGLAWTASVNGHDLPCVATTDTLTINVPEEATHDNGEWTAYIDGSPEITGPWRSSYLSSAPLRIKATVVFASTRVQVVAAGRPGSAGTGGGGAVSSVDGRTGAVTLSDRYDAIGAAAAEAAARATAVTNEATTRAAQDALLVPLTQKATANGVATLDSGGKVPSAQLPAIAITDYLGDVASQAAMLALSGQRGDWCTRSDLSASFILITDDPSSLANWKQLPTPADAVSSVNGRTGPVTGLAEATDVSAEASTRAGQDALRLLIAGHTAQSVQVADGSGNVTDLAMAASTILARLASGGTIAATPAQLRTLLALVIGANVQAWDADLDAIAALSTTSFGRALLALADAAALRTAAGLGGAATLNVGTTAGTVAAGDDSRFSAGGVTADMLPWLISIDLLATPAHGPTAGGWSRVAWNGFWRYWVVYSDGGGVVGWDVPLAAGTWQVELIHRAVDGMGIYLFKLDGTLVGTIDSYSASDTPNTVSTFTFTVAATGKKALTVDMTTKNPASAGTAAYWEALTLTRLS